MSDIRNFPDVPAEKSGNLCNAMTVIATLGKMMDSHDPAPSKGGNSLASDLARRLARYRDRIAAEGRTQSVRVVDQAIKDAKREQ